MDDSAWSKCNCLLCNSSVIVHKKPAFGEPNVSIWDLRSSFNTTAISEHTAEEKKDFVQLLAELLQKEIVREKCRKY